MSDDVLVEIGPFFRGARVLDDGARVWSQPGVIGAHLNRLLAVHKTRIGPDPASIDAAMVGGILANNSSGMCCGVAQNSYHTLDSLRVLLADGAEVDTAQPDADAQLRRARPALHAELLALRDEIRRDEALAARIRHKFSTKNTSGYSLNAFVDFERPADILAHLMVGSEGTLGFVGETTFRTVPEPPARATALVFFADLEEAGASVAPLAAAGADALEILDAASLRSVSAEHPLPFEIERRHAALLVEFRRMDEARLDAATSDAQAILARYRLLEPPRFTTGEAERAALWHVRKGLAARTGAMRPTGTAFLTEDVAVPVARLAEAILDCQALFERHGVPDTVIFGHAKDGNLHFVMSEDVRSPEAVERYGAFIQGLVDLVVNKYDGAIKAEHGAGRNMAPFVRTEWGDRAYGVMERVKRMLDPAGVLNPGVKLNPSPRAHLESLKPCPTISPLADRCTECGFCESRCPSRDLTLTPRQRIVVTRELTRLRASTAPGDREWAEALEADFAYEGLATCAGDSMCQAACPVKIDTGALVKELKAAAHPEWSNQVATAVAERFALVAEAARAGMGTAAAVRALPLGVALVELASDAAHALAPTLVPRLPAGLALPLPALALPKARPETAPPPGVAPPAAGRGVVYFPSCLTPHRRRPAGRGHPAPGPSDGRGAAVGRVLGAPARRHRRPLLRDGLRQQGIPGGRAGGGPQDGRGPVARVERRAPAGRDRRLALRRHARRPRDRDPEGGPARGAHARLPQLLGPRGPARPGGRAASQGHRDPPPDLHAHQVGRGRRPPGGGPRPRGEGGGAALRRVLRLRRRPGLPRARAHGERDGGGGGRGAPHPGARARRRLLLDVPHVRDRPVARGGPTLPLAPAPGARGRGACLSGSSTRSRRCRSSRPTSR